MKTTGPRDSASLWSSSSSSLDSEPLGNHLPLGGVTLDGLVAGLRRGREFKKTSEGAVQTTTMDSHVRQTKRLKPLARRNLQALFDAAALDAESYRSSSSSIDLENSSDTYYEFEEREGIELSSIERPFKSGSESFGPSTPDAVDTVDAVLPAAVNRVQGKSMVEKMPQEEMQSIQDNDGLKKEEQGSIVSHSVPLRRFMESSRGRAMTIHEAKAIVYRIAEDLSRLHSVGIIHRRVRDDVAVLNITNNYGLAKLPCGPMALKVPLSTTCCYGHRENSVEPHLPPEALHCPEDRTVYNREGDVWALGILTFKLLHGGKMPFSISELWEMGGSVDALQDWITKSISRSKARHAPQCEYSDASKFTDDDQERAKAMDFISRALHADPGQRPTAYEILLDPWLKDAPDILPSTSVVYGAADAGDTLSNQMNVAPNNETSCGSLNGSSTTLLASEEIEVPSRSVNNSSLLPYPVLGHVAQEIQVEDSGGIKRTMSAFHIVYDVPGCGPMMSAAPCHVVPMVK